MDTTRIYWRYDWNVSHLIVQRSSQALRDAASARGSGLAHQVHPGYSTLDTHGAPVLTEELKRQLAETRAVNEYRSQQELRQQSREKLDSSSHGLDQDEMGPIRIRNLEDLIR